MSRIGYNIKQAFTQIGRNKGMSLASVFAITAMMLILGLFFVITVNINLFTEMVKTDYDQIEIFLEDSTSAEEAQQIMDAVESHDHVKQVEYPEQGGRAEDPEEALGRERLSAGLSGRQPAAQLAAGHGGVPGKCRRGDRLPLHL